jgi:hypothetical protein
MVPKNSEKKRNPIMVLKKNQIPPGSILDWKLNKNRQVCFAMKQVRFAEAPELVILGENGKPKRNLAIVSKAHSAPYSLT